MSIHRDCVRVGADRRHSWNDRFLLIKKEAADVEALCKSVCGKREFYLFCKCVRCVANPRRIAVVPLWTDGQLECSACAHCYRWC